MSDVASGVTTTFDRIIRLISVIVWPGVLSAGVFIYRDKIRRVVDALVALAEKADEVKIGQLEIKRKLDAVGEQVTASKVSETPELIPPSQKVAAEEIAHIVSAVSSSRSRDLLRLQVRQKMERFALRYEERRRRLTAGHERTYEMDRITAQMRSLGLAAKPFLEEFSRSPSPGKRLGAIAILQVAPSSAYLDWLFKRFHDEQPFVFYQASLAILQCVRKYGPRRFHSLRKRIEAAIQEIQSYSGGEPDRNTLAVLRGALQELEQLRPENLS